MVRIRIPVGSQAEDKILSFYTSLYSDYLEECKQSGQPILYSRDGLIKNIKKALEIDGLCIHSRKLRSNTIIDRWRENGWYELSFRSWHYALELKRNGEEIVGIVMDAINNVDYHNDLMENQPYDSHNETLAALIKRIVKKTIIK